MNKKHKKIEAVDLFCGVGGLTHGLQQAGIKVNLGIDLEDACSYSYQVNNHSNFMCKDVRLVTKFDIESAFSNDVDVKILAGCAPCQPFSSYQKGKDTSTDKKWPLLYEFARLIQETSPDVVTMENVPDVTKHKVYHDFVANLENIGFYVWANTVHCVEYGLPQNRKRHVLLASKRGRIHIVSPTHSKPVTVKQAIGNLKPLNAGEADNFDPLHKAAGLSALNLQRIRLSKPGGSWKDWPESLVADCHKRQNGKTYPSVYGRMSWDDASPTITTQCYGYGNGRFGHPEQDRAISLREAAILQSFPNTYKFIPPGEEVSFTKIGRMIGNAVPVVLGKVIGQSILEHLNSN